jgi:4-amino-4-deoxy-L-arabinose transferase-like glycosyltransferase
MPRSRYYLFLFAIAVVYGISATVDVMNIDAAQYASIAREMLETGEYLQVKHREADYLDKPPLLFWLSALSFKVLGISNVAYKLPSLLFALLGIYSTYRLGSLLYSAATGRLAALMLASTQAMFLIINDVRTDTMLTGAVIFSIWNIAAYDRNGKWGHLLAATIGVALGMLAKGPIGIMAPGLALGAHFVLKGQWRSLFRWQWFVALGGVALLLAPMLWGLYQQFDMNPEKGVSGIRFFLWDQSFGRLTGDNPFINSQATPPPKAPFFFVHTVLWAFLPWTLLFLLAFWDRARRLVMSRFALRPDEEVITMGGFILVFVGMSLSAYKLPHYIFVVFPLAAIITAEYVERVCSGSQRLARGLLAFHAGLSALLWALLLALCVYSFPMESALLWMVLLAAAALCVVVLRFKVPPASKLVTVPLITVIAVNLALSGHLYPQLLQYQSTAVVGKRVAEMGLPHDYFVSYRTGAHALDYYSQRVVPWLSEAGDMSGLVAMHDTWVFTDDAGMADLEAHGLVADSVTAYPDYRVAILTLQLLLPSEREQVVGTKYLLRFDQR